MGHSFILHSRYTRNYASPRPKGVHHHVINMQCSHNLPCLKLKYCVESALDLFLFLRRVSIGKLSSSNGFNMLFNRALSLPTWVPATWVSSAALLYGPKTYHICTTSWVSYFYILERVVLRYNTGGKGLLSKDASSLYSVDQQHRHSWKVELISLPSSWEAAHLFLCYK